MPRLQIDIRSPRKWENAPRVSKIYERNEVVGADDILPVASTFTIEFEYPLSRPSVRTYKHEGNFTKYDLLMAITVGYQEIYQEENSAVGDPGHIEGMLNRNRSDGPYGIWGHDIGDLVVEAIEYNEAEDNLIHHFELWMGS